MNVAGRTSGGSGDGKAPGAMRTIGEVSSELGIKPHVLRYWENQFAMLRPLKRSGGRRLYRPEDIALIARIDRLVNRQGYTIRGARQALLAGEQDRSTTAEPADAAHVLASLKDIRTRLAAALSA